MKLKFSNPFTKIGAGVSAYLMAANAYAQGTVGFGSMATAVAGNFWEATDVVSTASYVVGAGFGMAGVMKLKQHAESPGNVSINAGLGRIGAGASLVALPWVINTAFNTAGVGDQSASTGVVNSSGNRFVN